jgi:hypothetical protein
MRQIRTSGSMSGRWKRGMAELVRHRQTKEPVTDRLPLNHRATSRLYPFQARAFCLRNQLRPSSPLSSEDQGTGGHSWKVLVTLEGLWLANCLS